MFGTFTTDVQGLINVSTLADGTYLIKEISPPSGYQADAPNQQVTINAANNKPTTVTFYDTKIMGVVITKVDEATNAPLKGATFKVTTVTGTVVGTFVTDSNGEIDVTKDANGKPLPSGNYIVTETIAPTGYAIDQTPQTCTVVAGNKTTVNFKDQKLQGVIIQKLDSANNQPLSGAQFEIWTTNGSSDTSVSSSSPTGTLIGSYSTDTSGTISVATLVNGTYIAKEVKPPNGYQMDAPSQVFTVSAGTPTTVTFHDTKIQGLMIQKIDAQTHDPLAGAVFEVWETSASSNTSVSSSQPAGILVGTYSTDAQGLITISALEDGVYTIKEKKAPDSYKLDAPNQDVTVKANNNKPTTVTFSDSKLTGLQIKKIDSITGNPLAGAKFAIYKQNGEVIGEDYTTDTTGFINVPTLQPDYYIVKETNAPTGYVLNETPKTVQVKTYAPTIVTFEDIPLTGLQIKKIDSVTRQPIGNVVFSVSKMNGEKIGEFTTGKDGLIYVPDLSVSWYSVTEIKAAPGYKLDSEPKNIEVKDGKNAVLEVENTPESSILILKTDAQTKKALAGVEFEVDKTNGEVVGTYDTDANGRIFVNNIGAGDYQIVEKQALKGYILDTSIHKVTVIDGQQALVELKNTQMAGLKIHKIDAVTGEGIYNVAFRVYDFDTNKEAGGPYYSDNNGYVDFTGILPEGRYKIVETRPADGYLRDDMPKTIDFKAGETTEITWKNTPVMGQIQITKKSADDNEVNGLPAGTPLKGAVFEVDAYKSGKMVDQFTTGNNGVGASKPLPLGRYSIKEVTAPKYYKISTETIDATLEFSSQILKYDFTDEAANTGVSIKKVGPKETMPGQGDIKYDFKAISNDSTVPLTDFFWRDILPTNAVRLDKIVTGTYNQSVKYKIMYKTNKNDYRVMADNLSSTKNNVVDASPDALGLDNDEYVTAFMIVFGNVKSGFSLVDTASVYVNVNKNLPNGLKFSNKADVGGKYQGQWVIGNSTCSTTVYSPTPAKMPRTGY